MNAKRDNSKPGAVGKHSILRRSSKTSSDTSKTDDKLSEMPPTPKEDPSFDISDILNQYRKRNMFYDPSTATNDEHESEKGTESDDEPDMLDKLLTQQQPQPRKKQRIAIPVSKGSNKPGRYIALDCEMVGIGPDGEESALARVSIVNFHGHVLMDEYVRPKERVTDFRTEVSGITPHHLKNAKEFCAVQKMVDELIHGRTLVGHGLINDLEVLLLSHPRHLVRDTAHYKPFRKIANGRTPSLRNLVKHFLKREIQDSHHSSVEDARAVMDLYKLVKDEWETHLTKKHTLKSKRNTNQQE